jgi:predicted amidohydrolase
MSNYIKIASLAGSRNIDAKYGWSMEDAVINMIKYWDNMLDNVLCEKPDIIVLPEACDRYSNHNMNERLEYYDTRGNRIRDHLMDVAKKNSCYIAYSAARVDDDGKWRNSTQLLDRDGNIAGIYDKNHLTIFEMDKAKMFCGKEAVVIDCDFGTVGFAICYDLNFDAIRNQYAKLKSDIILFSSQYHGGLMQQYWAYSTRSYFTGCIKGLQNTIISPVGQIIAASTNYRNYITDKVNLDSCVIHLDYNADKFKSIKNKYGPLVTISDPGYLGSVLISSESNEFTVSDIIKEFNLELLDDYFDRALLYREENIKENSR